MEKQADPSKLPSESDKQLFEDIEKRWERSVKGASSSRLSMSKALQKIHERKQKEV